MLYIKEINDRKGKIIFSLILILTLIFVLAFTKNYSISILKSLEKSNFNKFPFNYNNFNSLIEKLDRDFDFYIFSQWIGKNFIQFMFLFTIMFSFSIFSKEKENKTFYFLLSRFSRNTIYHTKVLISYLMSLFITSVGIVSSYLPYLILNHHPSINYFIFLPGIVLFLPCYFLLKQLFLFFQIIQ